MIPAFGEYVKAVRLIRGLRIVDLVRLIGITNRKNEAKPIRQVLELERSGNCVPQFFQRVAEALELDPEKLIELATDHEANIERVLNFPAAPLLRWQHRWTVTKFGLVWREQYMPVGTSVPRALAYAATVAKDEHVEVHVHVSPRQVVIVDEEGHIKRIERTPQPLKSEHVTILGKRFHLRVYR